MQKVTIIGAGNIGRAIAKGIKASGNYELTVTNHAQAEIDKLTAEGFEVLTDNKKAVENSDIIMFAVRPHQIDLVLSEITEALREDHIIASLVSGITIQNIKDKTGNRTKHVHRVMPNTASAVAYSMTIIAENSEPSTRQVVTDIFSTIGETAQLPERLFAEATVLAGSGTAIAMTFIRAMMRAGVHAGVHEKDALAIAIQVVRGAGELLLQSHSHPEEEIDRVTTPGGCTIEALIAMDHAGFNSALLTGIKTGIDKAKQLY